MYYTKYLKEPSDFMDEEQAIIEGVKVLIKKTEDGYIASVPELKGCSAVKVKEKSDIEPQIKLALIKYLRELYGLPPQEFRIKFLEYKEENKRNDEESTDKNKKQKIGV